MPHNDGQAKPITESTYEEINANRHKSEREQLRELGGTEADAAELPPEESWSVEDHIKQIRNETP